MLGRMIVYDDIDSRAAPGGCEDVHPQPRPGASERLLALAEKFRGKEKQTREQDLAGANGPVEKRLSHAWCTASPNSSKRTPKRAADGRAAAERDRRPADGRP